LAALSAGPAAAASAETMLERRETAKAAAERANGGKAVVKLSALMKFIMVGGLHKLNAAACVCVCVFLCVYVCVCVCVDPYQ
jgi:Na+/alanine symporter